METQDCRLWLLPEWIRKLREARLGQALGLSINQGTVQVTKI